MTLRAMGRQGRALNASMDASAAVRSSLRGSWSFDSFHGEALDGTDVGHLWMPSSPNGTRHGSISSAAASAPSMLTVAVGARATSLTAALQLDIGRPMDALRTVGRALEWLDAVAPRLLFPMARVTGGGGEAPSNSSAGEASSRDAAALAHSVWLDWAEANQRCVVAAENVQSLQLLRAEALWALSDYFASLELQRNVALASLATSPAQALCGLLQTDGPPGGEKQGALALF